MTLRSPAFATSDNKTTSTLSLRVCGLSSSRWQLFIFCFVMFSSWLYAELVSMAWYHFDLTVKKVSSFVFSPRSFAALPCPQLHCRWHICIWLFAETLPVVPGSCWETLLLSPCCAVWNRPWPLLLFLSTSLHSSLLCLVLSCLSLSLSLMQEDNSYSPTRSWLRGIRGQKSFTAGKHYSEWQWQQLQLILNNLIQYYTMWTIRTPICHEHPIPQRQV